MDSRQELQHLRLLRSLFVVSGVVRDKRGLVVPTRLRYALYLLAVFAVRRRNLGRRERRGAALNPNPPSSARQLRRSPATISLRAALLNRLAHFSPQISRKRGPLAISYQ